MSKYCRTALSCLSEASSSSSSSSLLLSTTSSSKLAVSVHGFKFIAFPLCVLCSFLSVFVFFGSRFSSCCYQANSAVNDMLLRGLRSASFLSCCCCCCCWCWCSRKATTQMSIISDYFRTGLSSFRLITPPSSQHRPSLFVRSFFVAAKYLPPKK